MSKPTSSNASSTAKPATTNTASRPATPPAAPTTTSRATTPASTSSPTPTMAQPTTPTTAPVTHERVAMRAYEHWVKRGRPPGSPDQDWHKAEQELRSESKNQAR